MKLLIEFLPVVLFFVVYKLAGLYTAIYTMIGATFVQLLVTRYTSGQFKKIHVVTFVLLLIFGGISIAFRNPAFIMWKVSVLYIVFAIALFVSLLISKKTLLQLVIGKELSLPKQVWHKLTWLWGLGFIMIAVVNSYYVILASNARQKLFNNTSLDSKIELTKFDCSSIPFQELCISAQQTEESWVNFKLFGTMGLTITLIVITVFFISKYITK